MSVDQKLRSPRLFFDSLVQGGVPESVASRVAAIRAMELNKDVFPFERSDADNADFQLAELIVGSAKFKDLLDAMEREFASCQ